MKTLKKEAIDYLGIIHGEDTRKVLVQLEVVAKEAHECEQLNKLTTEEYETLQNLLRKYFEMIKSL